nr:MAG TPA: UBA-like domain protein [Caudoviricetes sp.]
MKKTIDLLNEVVAMGFDREQALADIDASLDSELEERKPLMEEEIPESLYDDILEGFRADKEMNV